MDPAALFPEIEIDEQFLYQQEHLLLGLNYALVKSARTDSALMDVDLIAALSSTASTYETLTKSGLLYETPLTAIGQQAVATEVKNMVEEFRHAEEQHMGHARLRDADILQALVFLLRIAYTRTSGRPKSRAFLDFLFEQFPEKQSSIVPLEAADGSIITA